MSTSTFGTQCVQTDNILCKVTIWIWRIAPVICITVGTFGNAINIAILCRKNLRSKPCFILIFAAISDLFFLWTTPLADLFRFGYGMSFDAVSYSLCLANILMGFVFSTTSLWMLAIFTIGRILFILLPHRSNIHLNRNKSIAAFIGVFVSICILQVVPTSIIETAEVASANTASNRDSQNSTSCLNFAYDDEDSSERALEILLFAVSLLVPILIIVFGNCILAYNLCRRPNQSDADTAQVYLLFAISGLLLVTCLPYGVFYFILQVVGEQTDIKAPIFGLVYAVVENLATCNYALNFFIYLGKSSMFKAEFNTFVGEIKSRVFRG